VVNEIEVTRRDMAHWKLDPSKCGDLFEHLTKYHESETTGKPCHRNNCSICKGASHGADTARLLAIARDEKMIEPYLLERGYAVSSTPEILDDSWVIA
jgi:hypothetical protein